MSLYYSWSLTCTRGWLALEGATSAPCGVVMTSCTCPIFVKLIDCGCQAIREHFEFDDAWAWSIWLETAVFAVDVDLMMEVKELTCFFIAARRIRAFLREAIRRVRFWKLWPKSARHDLKVIDAIGDWDFRLNAREKQSLMDVSEV